MQSLEAFKSSLTLPSPLEPFHPNWEGASKVSLFVKRDDAIHPVISGNKWRKLTNALIAPLPREILSFGGGFSNHIHALGFACFKLGIPFTAVVRGDYRNNPTPMLQDLMQWSANIEYVDRITYKKRDDKAYLNQLQQQHNNAMIIPEGGSQTQALQGIQHMVEEIDVDFDVMVTPVASGATLAGIASALNSFNEKTMAINEHDVVRKAIGIGVLKGEGYLEGLVEKLLPASISQNDGQKSENETLPTQPQCWHIDHNYHFGGYAKAPDELKAFCNNFNQTMPFEIEPVYSGKAFWAVKDMLAKGKFEDGTRIVILHTGGLQGAR
ncbi:1-aminocyclopropane-1-carboxylate deaminase/D-cysteine desulfhydrase [Alteromonas gracilis]|uniref:1-aminocyclopropane-1-carboxylate deaminase/D-cysteine desulfhydrase n=1 Tax=Alteromonas gracilis TaxID=1479524 RepID=UPI003735B251